MLLSGKSTKTQEMGVRLVCLHQFLIDFFSFAGESLKFYGQHKSQLQPGITYSALNVKDLSDVIHLDTEEKIEFYL